MRILIADDQPTNLKLLRAMLEAEGHRVVEAADGVEALEILQREKVEAIISDILMPRMDGYRLCIEVRKTEKLKELPFVFYTATYVSPSDAKTAIEVGADKFLKKPSPIKEVLGALRDALQAASHRPPRQSPPKAELDLMKEYNARLVAKLEKKNQDLETQAESMRQSQEQMRLQATALAMAANAITITDARGAILWVNPAFSALTGYTSTEARGKNPRILNSGKHDEGFYRTLWETILGGQTWRGEFTNRRKDGTLFYGEQTITPVLDDDGKITRFVGIMNDVTERKKLESQLLRNQRMESIGTLAGGIAHDLNNAIAPAMMALQMLQMKFTDRESASLLDMLAASTQRAAEMVKQVLTFSRGLEGKQTNVQLRHLISEMQKIVRQTFPKTIRFDASVAKDLWMVTGDATQLHQVLLNLCVNARDAMPQGGTLSIKAENLKLDEHFAQINSEAKPGPYLMISVTDSGTGIPPEIRERIFEPFFTTKPIGQGTGLGLSTVCGIVKGHGGFISVHSETGKGTQFRIYLPAAPAASARRSEAVPGALPMGKGELILVVDDEAAVRSIAQQTLEMFGYHVLTAADGAQAVAACARHVGKIKLMLTDMMMPILDGAAATRAVRTLDPAVKVIAASGMPVDGSVSDREHGGANAVLPKPYTAERLLKTVRHVLDGTAPD
jgi:PAS domain S-box-containing protein